MLQLSISNLSVAKCIFSHLQKLSRAARVEFWADSARPAPQGWLARGHKQAIRAKSKALAELRVRFKELFVGLHDLLEYWQINHEGFRKVLKKHDKVRDGAGSMSVSKGGCGFCFVVLTFSLPRRRNRKRFGQLLKRLE